MDFYDVLDQVLDLLRQRGRVTYNALKRPFELDDACLQDLKDEIIVARLAVDEADKVLVWTGDAAAPPPPAADPAVRARAPDTAPLAYTPPISSTRSSPPARPWQASANRSPSSLPISRTRPGSSRASIRKPPSSSWTLPCA
jgi:hypothetical protein